MNLAAVASGHVDGGRTAAKATQRDRMREMIERKGGKLPVAEREQGEAPVVVVDLAEIAQREKDDMNGYHGLSVDDASGLKMFYTGNTLSERKRKEKQRQFRIVYFYVELARHAQAVGADVETRKLSGRQAAVAHTIFNSTNYMAWLALVYGTHMALGFWEPAHFGESYDDVPHAAPDSWFVALVDFCCISAYGIDCLLQVYVAGWRDFYSRASSKLHMALVAGMAVNMFAGPPFARYARPMLVFVRHVRIRAECGMMARAAINSFSQFFLLLAVLGVGGVFSVILLREEYGGEVLPDVGSGVASAASVGGFTNIHRAVLTLLSLLTTSDHYQLVYVARDYPEATLARQLASLFLVAISAALTLAAGNTSWALFAAYQRELDRARQLRQSRQRRFLALSFKTLDDRKDSYVSIEKLRLLLATIYPAVPFAPVAEKLRRNVEQQSGLVDFFDYLTVMDSVLQYEAPDPMLLYHTHLWHTLPLAAVISNAALLALFGTVGNDSSLDSCNAFFTFLYGVEIGAKIFALRPTRFWRSQSNRIDFTLVTLAVVAQIMTIITIFEAKAFWRCWASLPLLRVFVLSNALRHALQDLKRALTGGAPGLAAVWLVAYSFAIGGMQLFHGQLRTETGYPGQYHSFDNFASALLLLWQVLSGGWARTLLGPAGGAGPHGQVAWKVGSSNYGLLEGMEPWKEGPTILGGPVRPGQVDPAHAVGNRWVSWYLLLFRLIAVSMVGATAVRACLAVAMDRGERRRHEARVAAAGGAAVEQFGQPAGVAVAAGLPSLKTEQQRDHVANMLMGVQRLQAEVTVMEHGHTIHHLGEARGAAASARSELGTQQQLALTNESADGP